MSQLPPGSIHLSCGSSDNTAQDPGCPVGQQAACSTSSGAGGSSAATSPSAAAACPTPAASSGTDSFAATVALTTAGDGLQQGDAKAGTGTSAATGHKVYVEYTGWLQSGQQFDSSRQSGRTPFGFTLGQGEVIKGWDEGVAGMKVGEKRNLVIPPDLAYGAAGRPSIPPNSTLMFDVELIGFARPGQGQ